MKTGKAYKPLANLILTVFFSFSFIFALTESMLFCDFMGNYAQPLFLLICLYIAACYLIEKYVRNKKALLIYTAAGTVLLFAFPLLAGPKNSRVFYGYFADFWRWFMQFLKYADNFYRPYAIITIFLLCLLLVPPIYYFTRVHYNFYVIMISGLSLFLIQWIKGYFMSYTAFYIFMFLLLILYLLHVYQIHSESEQSDLVSLQTFIAWILPVCIVVFALSFKISQHTKPPRISWLNRALLSFLDDMNKTGSFRAFDYFSLGITGFGDEGRLGGPVSLDDTVVMEVTASRRIYLKGASPDYYTGSAWINWQNTRQLIDNPNNSNSLDVLLSETSDLFEGGSKDNPMNVDFLEITEGPRLLGFTDYKKSIFYIDDISVKYVALNTRSLFVPLKTRRIVYTNVSKPLKTYIDKSGVYSLDRKAKKNFSYNLVTLTPRYNDENFINLLKKSEKGLYSNYSHGLKVGVTVDTVKRLDNYASEIYRIYTQLPGNLPSRVSQLAYSISQPYDNNYDKVKAIETYLVSNYAYTLRPGETPEGRDFVDYFLFDLKEGYCTYYASAMVVMVRSLGIPARYVEGYMLPPKSDGFSKYTVTNQQAHAWVEVYFEGVGWVTFEPTPPFNRVFYNSTKPFDTKLSKDFEEDPAYRDYLRLLREYDRSVDDKAYREALAKQIITVSAVVFSTVFLVIALIFLYNISVRKYRMRSVEKMKPRECILYLMAYYMKILALLGLEIKKGETPLEYSKRVGKILLYDRYAFRNEPMEKFLERIKNLEDIHKQSKFMAVMDAFIMARYNPSAVTEEHKQTVLSYYGQLMEKVRISMGRPRYFYNKYILGKFNFK